MYHHSTCCSMVQRFVLKSTMRLQLQNSRSICKEDALNYLISLRQDSSGLVSPALCSAVKHTRLYQPTIDENLDFVSQREKGFTYGSQLIHPSNLRYMLEDWWQKDDPCGSFPKSVSYTREIELDYQQNLPFLVTSWLILPSAFIALQCTKLERQTINFLDQLLCPSSCHLAN